MGVKDMFENTELKFTPFIQTIVTDVYENRSPVDHYHDPNYELIGKIFRYLMLNFSKQSNLYF